MSSRVWLTVITVVKDDAPGFERTLQSLLIQDLDGVEYVIIDSSTNPEELPVRLRSSGLPGQIYWTPPAGIYAAMNAGLAAAAGEYVYFLNAGDELAGPNTLQQVRSVLNNGGPEWAYGDAEIVGADGTSVLTPDWDYQVEEARAFSAGHFPTHQSTFVRTKTLRTIGGFNESYVIAADYSAFLELTQITPGQKLPFVIARFHEGGISTTRWAHSLREFHRARVSILQPSGALAQRERLASTRQFLAMALHRSPWPLVVCLAFLVFTLMGLTGVAWTQSALLTLFVLLQGIGGAIWWRMLRPTRSVPILECVGMGLGLGSAGALLCGLVLTWWLAPLLSLAAWLVLIRLRGRSLSPLAPLSRPDLLALVIGIVPGLFAFLFAMRSYPLSWTGLWTGYHGDMAFFEALSTSVARLGPTSSIFMSGFDLRYHSLAYGWAGQLTQAVDAAPFVVLTRLLPLVTLVAATALAAAWTRRLTRVWWAPALAVGLVITGGFVGATFGSVLNFDSPSQSMGAVWLLALSVLILQCLERVNLPWHLVAVVVLVAVLTGGKVSTAAVGIGGLLMMVVIGLARREPWRWRALAVGVAALTTSVIAYSLLLAGSANSGGLGLFTLLDRASSVQGLNPVVTPRGIIAGVFLLILAALPRWAGLVWLIGDRRSRWAPETTYGLGLLLGGIGTIVILSGGINDLWFAVAASAPLAVLSTVGVANAAVWLGDRGRGRMKFAAIAGLAISAIVCVVWATGSTGIIGIGWRWIGPLLAILMAVIAGFSLAKGINKSTFRAASALTIVALVIAALPARFLYGVAEPFARPQPPASPVLFSQQTEFTATLDLDGQTGFTDTQAVMARWLRVNANIDDVVATNVTLTPLVPALTRLTTYVSDIHMQAPYGLAEDLPVVQKRETESWAFIDSPTDDSLAPLCAAGVKWVWVDPRRTQTTDWRPFATIAASSPDAVVLRISESECR